MFTEPELPRTFRCGPLSQPPADTNDVTDGEDPPAGQAVVVTGSMTGPLAALSRTR